MKEKKFKKHYYNNGEVQRKFSDDDIIPEGFVRGMLPWTEEHKQKINDKRKGRIPWNKGKKGLQVSWNKGIPMSEDAKIKRKQTMKELYPNGREAWNKGMKFPGMTNNGSFKKGNIPWNSGLEYDDELRKILSLAHIGKKLDDTTREQANRKRYETKKKNHTFKQSAPEEIYWQHLLEKFDSDDIVREYMEDRYPFKCDFYIKSKDLFIELNLFPTHGTHRFDPYSIEDSVEVERLKSLPQTRLNHLNIEVPSFAATQLYIWTKYDPLKFRYAKENNLKYKVYYSLEEALRDLINV